VADCLLDNPEEIDIFLSIGISYTYFTFNIFPRYLNHFQVRVFIKKRRSWMDHKELKKILAGLGIATLVSAASVAVPGELQAASG
jgi:radical SAM modification target selenobiotic family peptide